MKTFLTLLTAAAAFVIALASPVVAGHLVNTVADELNSDDE